MSKFCIIVQRWSELNTFSQRFSPDVFKAFPSHEILTAKQQLLNSKFTLLFSKSPSFLSVCWGSFSGSVDCGCVSARSCWSNLRGWSVPEGLNKPNSHPVFSCCRPLWVHHHLQHTNISSEVVPVFLLTPSSVDLFLFTSRFYCEGNLYWVVFLLYFLEQQDQFSLGFSSSVCFPPPPLVHHGSVYCLSKYFMTLTSYPQTHSFIQLLKHHMNKWEETTGEAVSEACWPQQLMHSLSAVDSSIRSFR